MATATAPTKDKALVARPEQAALAALDSELERRQSVFEASAASLIDPQRLKAIVLSQFTRNPELWECDTVSIARAVVESATYGLEPTGAIGGAHLVPFFNSKTGKKEVQLIIDYRGYVRLARRSGEVSKVWARVVREKDEFYVEAGSADRIHHRPYLGQDDPGNVTHVYACIQYRDGSDPQFDWDTHAWVETIRKRAKAKDKGPWVTDWAEMAKKTILRRLLKMSPLTIEARQAIEMEEQAEAEVAQTRSGRPSQAIAKIHERLGVAPAPAQLEEPDGSRVPSAQSHGEAEPDAGPGEAHEVEAAGVVTAPAADLAEDADYTEVATEVFGGDIKKPVVAGENDPAVQAGMDLIKGPGKHL